MALQPVFVFQRPSLYAQAILLYTFILLLCVAYSLVRVRSHHSACPILSLPFHFRFVKTLSPLGFDPQQFPPFYLLLLALMATILSFFRESWLPILIFFTRGVDFLSCSQPAPPQFLLLARIPKLISLSCRCFPP